MNFASLGTNSSGNLICIHELDFLKSISDKTIQLGFEDNINLAQHILVYQYDCYLKAKGITVTSTVCSCP